ncbi:MAG: amidase [Nocardioidaceae bacterium]
MDVDDLCLISLEAVGALIAAKDVSPVELTEALLRRVERYQPDLNAFVTVTADQALDSARRAEREIAKGSYRGSLHGVPVALKDNIATKGVRTTAGSRVLSDWVPGQDAHVVRRLRLAGAVCVGKLGMHEFAFGTTSDNPHFGEIRNPWDLSRSPGGSSGGSGVATAMGMAFATLGTDTAGSIRIPASECGCVGLKATYGRVALRGVIPLAPTLDHVGPLTRTVNDAAIVLRAVAGHEPGGAGSAIRPLPDLVPDLESRAHGLRIGVPCDYFWQGSGMWRTGGHRRALDGAIEGLVRAAVDVLASSGAVVVETMFEGAEKFSGCVGDIIAAEAAAEHTGWFPARSDEYGPGVASSLAYGATIPASVVAEKRAEVRRARAGAADQALRGVDVLAVPTMPAPPPTFHQVRSDGYDVRRTIFTGLFDVTGQPVVTVPCGFTAGGLPTGISFVGRRWDEQAVLRVARCYEQARGELPSPPAELRRS